MSLFAFQNRGGFPWFIYLWMTACKEKDAWGILYFGLAVICKSCSYVTKNCAVKSCWSQILTRIRLCAVSFPSVKLDFQLLLTMVFTQLLPKEMYFKKTLCTLKILHDRWFQNEDLFQGLWLREVSSLPGCCYLCLKIQNFLTESWLDCLCCQC